MELFLWLCLVKYSLLQSNLITDDYRMELRYEDCANWEMTFTPKWSADFDEEGNRELIKMIERGRK